MRYLSRMLKYLPCLADSPETLPNTDRMDKPLGETKLCGLIMRTVPAKWSEQYHLDSNNPRVPVESKRLFNTLKNIEKVVKARRKRNLAISRNPIPRKKQRTNTRNGNSGGGKELRVAERKNAHSVRRTVELRLRTSPRTVRSGTLTELRRKISVGAPAKRKTEVGERASSNSPNQWASSQVLLNNRTKRVRSANAMTAIARDPTPNRQLGGAIKV